jgi:hypothetical protein
MKKSKSKEILTKDREWCWNAIKDRPLSEIEVVANSMFSPGSLPDEPTPPQWTDRELAIVRAFAWMTDEVEQKMLNGMVVWAGGKMGARFGGK